MTKPDAVKAFNMLMDKAEGLNCNKIEIRPRQVNFPFVNSEDFDWSNWFVVLNSVELFDNFTQLTRFLEGE